ncbi:CHAT domain-containing protein [Namhaeicola litoreus]|uniref:CHAT domain-containing protein n=1 Tax=Namhaeicola litoreus TaxID=1052145 RepID=A0ABW3Y0C9_9FLAO
MKNYYLKTLLFILSILPLKAQNLEASFVDQTNKKIDSLNREGQFEKAYLIGNELLQELIETNSSEELMAKTYYTLSNVEISLGEYEKSISTSHKSLALFKKINDSLKIASAYNRLGVGYYFLYDYDSTQFYYKRSYDLKKKLGAEANEMAVSAYNLAIAYEDLSKIDEALDLYLEAEKFLLKNPERLSFLSDVYIGLAHLYNYNQEITKAEFYAEKAMDVGVKSYGEFNPNMTFVYTNYANILSVKGKYKRAIEMLERALEIRKNTYGNDHKWTSEAHYDLARVLMKDDQPTKAEKHLLESIEIAERTNNLPNLAMAKNTLGKLYVMEEISPEKVIPLLESSTKINRKIYGDTYLQIAENYLYLASFAKKNKDEELFRRSIDEVYKNVNYEDKNLNYVYTPFEILEALNLEGEWLLEEYEETKETALLFEKMELLEEQLELIEFAKNNYSSEHAKILVANDYHKVFEGGINTCWLLYQYTGDMKYADKAFSLSDKNRNHLLLQGFTQEKIWKTYGVPTELLEQEQSLKRELSAMNMNIHDLRTGETQKEELSKLLSDRLRLNRNLDSLQRSIKEKYLKETKLPNQELTLQFVSENISENAQMLSYFLGEKDVYTFFINKNKWDFVKNIEAEKVSSSIEEFQLKLLQKENLTAVGKTLYQFLLDDKIDDGRYDLIIIPDGELNYLPFEALIDGQNEYVVQNFNISYASSVRLFLEVNRPEFTYDCSNYWIGYTPDFQDDRTISASSTEVEKIGQLLNGFIFKGEDCSKENFFKNSTSYSIQHLATHGELDSLDYTMNKLDFSGSKLTSSEIAVAGIKANLAVLSACFTGFGTIEKGEGVMSLARAFHLSGVPAIMMSLWKVPDKETEELMVNFYKELKKGKNKSYALRQAKIKYLEKNKDPNLAHPYFWAGFVINGNTNPLPQPFSLNWYLYGGVFLSLFLLILIFKKIRS